MATAYFCGPGLMSCRFLMHACLEATANCRQMRTQTKGSNPGCLQASHGQQSSKSTSSSFTEELTSMTESPITHVVLPLKIFHRSHGCSISACFAHALPCWCMLCKWAANSCTSSLGHTGSTSNLPDASNKIGRGAGFVQNAVNWHSLRNIGPWDAESSMCQLEYSSSPSVRVNLALRNGNFCGERSQEF